MVEVSIIVPIYNAEAYLAALLDSILSQDFVDYELLLVDDGSSDGSPAICREYAAHDPRIRLLHQENRGVSAARNLGLDHVSPDSRYIYFCDADDTLRPGALRLLVDAMADGNYDMVIAEYNWYSTNGVVSFQIKDCTKRNMNRQAAIKEIILPTNKSMQDALWNKLFKTSIIRGNRLRFEETFNYNEDVLFIIQYICKAKGEHIYIPTSVYNYYMRQDGAAMSSRCHFNPGFISMFPSNTRIKNLIFNNTKDRSVRRRVLERYYEPYYIIHDLMVLDNCYDANLHKYLQKEIIQNGALRAYISQSLKSRPISRKFKSLMIFFCPKQYLIIKKHLKA